MDARKFTYATVLTLPEKGSVVLVASSIPELTRFWDLLTTIPLDTTKIQRVVLDQF